MKKISALILLLFASCLYSQQINLRSDVKNQLPIANGGTGSATAAGAWANLFTGAGIAANCPVLATASNGAITCSSFTGLPSGWTATGSGSSQVVTAPGTFAAGTAITSPLVNNGVSACYFSGSTADVKIANAFASLPLSLGKVDASCLGTTTQVLAGTISLTAGQELDFSDATTIIPAAVSSDVVHVVGGSILKGLHVGLGNYPITYSGSAVSFTCTTGGPIIGPEIDNLSIDGATSAPGIGLLINCPTLNYGAAYTHVNGMYTNGVLRPLVLSTSNGGWINANEFKGLTFLAVSTSIPATGITLLNAGKQIEANTFEGFFEGNGTPSSIGISATTTTTATANIDANTFNFNIYDSAYSWYVPSSSVSGRVNVNWVQGLLNGTSIDTLGADYIQNYSSDAFNFYTLQANALTLYPSLTQTAIAIVPAANDTRAEVYGANSSNSAYMWKIDDSGNAMFSGNVAAGATPSALATVAIIGDSLTQTTYGPLLGNAYAPLPSGLTVTNLGDSGQSPGQIAARIGAVPTYAISSTGTIPITGTATMTFTVGWEPVNASTTGQYLHGTWGGVPGKATYSSGCCAWVPDGTGSPVSVNNIYGAQFIPDQPSRNAVAQIFGMGHNVSQQAPQYVYQNLLASVANVPPWELYAVWSNTYDNGNSAVNWSGGQFWTINQQLNAWEQSTFGSHFINVNTPMLAAYDPTSAVDIEDATIHLVEPSSLRAVYGYGTLTNAIGATDTSIQMTCVGGSIPLNEDMLVFDTGANQELAFITAASGSCPGTITYTVNRLGIGNNEAHSAGVPAYNVDHLHMATPCIASLTGGNANNPNGWCGGQYIATAVATYVTANYNPSSAQAPAFTGLPDGSARLPSTLPTSTTQSQYGSAGNPVALVNAQIGWFSGNISMGMGIINAPQANLATLNLGNLQNTTGSPLSFFPSGSYYYFSPSSGATVFLGSGSNPFSWIYGGSESLTSTSGGLYGVGSALLLPSGNAQPANYLIGTGLSGGSYGPKSLASLGLVGTGSANTFTANQTISNSTGPQLTLNNGSGTTFGITQSGSYTVFNASSGSYYVQIAGKNIAQILASSVEWFSLGTATSSSGNYNSVSTNYYGSYWNGSSAVSDAWSVGESLSSGTTPTSVFYISKIGGAASWQVQMPNTVLIGATPTVSASQVGFGNSTTASSSCGSLTSSAGCLTINVAGTPHYIPYY